MHTKCLREISYWRVLNQALKCKRWYNDLQMFVIVICMCQIGHFNVFEGFLSKTRPNFNFITQCWDSQPLTKEKCSKASNYDVVLLSGKIHFYEGFQTCSYPQRVTSRDIVSAWSVKSTVSKHDLQRAFFCDSPPVHTCAAIPGRSTDRCVLLYLWRHQATLIFTTFLSWWRWRQIGIIKPWTNICSVGDTNRDSLHLNEMFHGSVITYFWILRTW